MVASLGASAVLVFGMPSSPLAQPWPVLGGSTLSALVGAVCSAFIPDPALAGAVAVGLAIALMVPLRCLHPPAGALALLLVLTSGWIGPKGHPALAVGRRFAILFAVGVAVLQGARQRLGDHVARLPVGWFSAQNSARLGHLITQGMMAVAQLPAHVFTPVISGAVTPLVLVTALFALHWPLGVLALLALPVLVAVMLLTARLGHSADSTYQQHFAQTSQRMVEFAQAQSVLRAFNGSGGATRLLDQAIDQQRHQQAAQHTARQDKRDIEPCIAHGPAENRV